MSAFHRWVLRETVQAPKANLAERTLGRKETQNMGVGKKMYSVVHSHHVAGKPKMTIWGACIYLERQCPA